VQVSVLRGREQPTLTGSAPDPHPLSQKLFNPAGLYDPTYERELRAPFSPSAIHPENRDRAASCRESRVHTVAQARRFGPSGGGAMTAARLLSRDASAKYLSVSLSTFKKHVRPRIKPVLVGTCVMFDLRDLDQWVETQKDGSSSGETPRSMDESPTCDSESTESVLSGRQNKARLERLRRAPRSFTPPQ
jgi:hypothetical protein